MQKEGWDWVAEVVGWEVHIPELDSVAIVSAPVVRQKFLIKQEHHAIT
jgi:hypothetical protein